MSKPPILTPFLDDADVILYAGDCIEVMRQMPENSVDAIVTDPPYGLEFMGKDWDSPWKGKASNEFNEIKAGTLGGFTKLPNHSRVNNVKCRSCDRWKFSSNPCECEKPDFPDARGAAMREFQAFSEAWAREAFRVLKPGGHLLAFAGTRTYHRMASGVEDAGFEIRDCIAWMYGSGFPKSLDVSKAIDKTNGESGRAFKFTSWMQTTGVTARQINDATATQMGNHYLTHPTQPAIPTAALWKVIRPLCGIVPNWVDELVDRIEAEREVIGIKTSGIANKEEKVRHTIGASKSVEVDITSPATPAAQKWNGWGTALKPAFEPVVVARKPLIGTVAQNVLEHGTGALNIDACRIGTDAGWSYPNGRGGQGWHGKDSLSKNLDKPIESTGGRWPANIALDATAAAMLDQQSGDRPGMASQRRLSPAKPGMFGAGHGSDTKPFHEGYDDTGGASRFFYTAKASRQDRNTSGADNTHPTVKPTELMRWLIRLVTPPGGIILDPFGGSGSTGVAARAENVRCILIEREDEYLEIIRNRLAQQNLFATEHRND